MPGSGKFQALIESSARDEKRRKMTGLCGDRADRPRGRGAVLVGNFDPRFASIQGNRKVQRGDTRPANGRQVRLKRQQGSI